MIKNTTKSKLKYDLLFELIGKMSKSEKRHFKVSCSSSKKSDKLFVRLFDAMDQMDKYDEYSILKKVPELKKSQLSNMKAHLQKNIMSSLRHLQIEHKTDIKIRNLMDHARVFYSKGMYRAALHTLDKAKKLAIQHEMNTAYFTCVEFEKKIESQHITGSIESKADNLSKEVNASLSNVIDNNRLSSMSLALYGRYLWHGYVKDENGYNDAKAHFDKGLIGIQYDALDFYGKLYFHQSHVWFSIHTQEFRNYYKHALDWVEHYDRHPTMKLNETAMYLKGVHNVLNVLYIYNARIRFSNAYDKFIKFKNDHLELMDWNCRQLISNIELIHGVNRYIMNCEFSNGALYLNELLKPKVIDEIENWNLHRKLTIYYKIACVYFGANEHDKALDYLNQINNKTYRNFRNDLQCFSRILSLISHYELKHYELLNYQIKNVYKFLLKMSEMQAVQAAIFKFLKKTPTMTEDKLISAFKKLEASLLELKNQKFEQRAFLYFDITSWLRSKIEGTTVELVMQRNLSTN